VLAVGQQDLLTTVAERLALTLHRDDTRSLLVYIIRLVRLQTLAMLDKEDVN
jgi:hypothetical protein